MRLLFLFFVVLTVANADQTKIGLENDRTQISASSRPKREGLHDMIKNKAEEKIEKHLGELKNLFHHNDRLKRGIKRKLIEYQAQRTVKKQIKKIKEKMRPSKNEEHHRTKRATTGDPLNQAQQMVQFNAMVKNIAHGKKGGR